MIIEHVNVFLSHVNVDLWHVCVLCCSFRGYVYFPYLHAIIGLSHTHLILGSKTRTMNWSIWCRSLLLPFGCDTWHRWMVGRSHSSIQASWSSNTCCWMRRNYTQLGEIASTGFPVGRHLPKSPENWPNTYGRLVVPSSSETYVHMSTFHSYMSTNINTHTCLHSIHTCLRTLTRTHVYV